VLRIRLGHQCEPLHCHEDKEFAVTVGGPAHDTGTVGAGLFVDKDGQGQQTLEGTCATGSARHYS
jgi:hypothetical protein